MDSEPLVVQALYSYSPKNNDELCFKKGDFITITQKDEGWWEGTFNDKTGWFPSNYVKEAKDAPVPIIKEQNQYKSVVLKDLIDSEKAHVTELVGLVTNFLQPLESSPILTSDEYKQLTGNINEVLETHQQLLALIESEATKPGIDQRVGRIFLTWSPRIKSVHQAYCALHPRAVCILDKYKDELTKYMEARGAASPGVLVLTTMLSKPFRRLDKYSGMMQELERHVEESHPDRGDTQRSVDIFKDIASSCAATRRQKELELQVLTGPIRGWEGPPPTTLGEIIFMGSVAVGPQHADRYYVLFPTTLVILSVSHRLSAFIFEGKLYLSGITVARLDDSDQYKNAFEISAPMIDKKIAVCQSKEEASHWVELLSKHMTKSPSSGSLSQKAPLHAQCIPHPPPHMSPQVSTGGPPQNTPNSRSLINSVHSTPTPPPHGSVLINNNRGWSVANLRPTPPLRPCLALGTIPSGPYSRYCRRSMSYKDDGLILEVIGAYCSAVKPRSTVNSVNVTNGPKADLTKSMQSAIQVIQSQLNVLDYNVKALTSQLTEEREARCALQTIVKKFVTANYKETDTFEWPTMESNI